jgi:hypothetical protein
LPTNNIIGGSPKSKDDFNDREDVKRDLREMPVQSYQTPQVTSSKAANLKSYNER